MKKTLYLMRHGQTLFNVQHKIQGWCDSPLTELGIKQAGVAAKYFEDQGITFDHAYCSTSERASDTLEIVTRHKLPYARFKGLKEWNFGAFEGKDECLNPPLPYGDFFKTYGGEGEKEFQDRINDTILSLMAQDNETVLIVAHGAACAQFARMWQERGPVRYRPGISNCAIFKYLYEDGTFTLTEIVTHDFSNL